MNKKARSTDEEGGCAGERERALLGDGGLDVDAELVRLALCIVPKSALNPGVAGKRRTWAMRWYGSSLARSFWAVDALPKKDELVELPSSGLVGIASASSSTKTNGVIVIWSKKDRKSVV